MLGGLRLTLRNELKNLRHWSVFSKCAGVCICERVIMPGDVDNQVLAADVATIQSTLATSHLRERRKCARRTHVVTSDTRWADEWQQLLCVTLSRSAWCCLLVYHTKVLLDKGIIDKGIIRTKVLLDKGIVRN